MLSLIKKQGKTALIESENTPVKFYDGTNADQWIIEKKFKAIIDIGANEGQFAKKFLSIVPEAQFYCFEPLIEPFQKLSDNFSKMNNFHLYSFALGDSEGKVKMNKNEYSPSSSMLPMRDEHKNAFEFARKEFEEFVSLKKMDDILKDEKLQNPYMIKIDVQGYELPVIEGGIETIKNADMIILETSFVKLYEGAPLFGDIYKKLTDLGFAYNGSFEQLMRPGDGKILQQDAIFERVKNSNE